MRNLKFKIKKFKSILSASEVAALEISIQRLYVWRSVKPAEIIIYHLPDDERVRYVLSCQGREF